MPKCRPPYNLTFSWDGPAFIIHYIYLCSDLTKLYRLEVGNETVSAATNPNRLWRQSQYLCLGIAASVRRRDETFVPTCCDWLDPSRWRLWWQCRYVHPNTSKRWPESGLSAIDLWSRWWWWWNGIRSVAMPMPSWVNRRRNHIHEDSFQMACY